jgi:hypothetical protein
MNQNLFVLLLHVLWLDFPILDKLSNKFEFGARARNSCSRLENNSSALTQHGFWSQLGERARSIIGGIAVEKLCATPAADEILIPRVRFEEKKSSTTFRLWRCEINIFGERRTARQ